ncbi:hypothetical protein [Paenibacillus sp. A14]|uniref:hypothetical protein n=1 Tax=Paenibacillus sp. A14 TaxID=3119820 RepID=UPI002FE1E996
MPVRDIRSYVPLWRAVQDKLTAEDVLIVIDQLEDAVRLELLHVRLGKPAWPMC